MLFVLQTLYTFPENFRAYKALIAAQYSDVNIKVASEPPEFTFGETNKTDAFLKKFPLGRVRLVRFNGSRQLFIIHNTAFERSELKSGPARPSGLITGQAGREGAVSRRPAQHCIKGTAGVYYVTVAARHTPTINQATRSTQL